MSTLAESWGPVRKPKMWVAAGVGVLLIWGVIALPRYSPEKVEREGLPQSSITSSQQALSARPSLAAHTKRVSQEVTEPASPQAADAAAGRKIVRTASMNMVVKNPAEVADKVTALAESLGGYLVSADGGGQSATSGALTIRVPAARFEQVRAEIRNLGWRVEGEKIEAEDVTRQFVDEDASIRNLRAEEAQYLAIMKQAATVKDMLAVSEQLSAVRGQIEQQQAEFNALSRQIETVAIAISLRTEFEAQVSGLNWRPGYQLKLALRDGMESLATYATAMTTILFYLPAMLLWVGTVLIGAAASWRVARWVGRRWFGSKTADPAAQVSNGL